MRSIIQEEKECFLCGGTVNLDSHHVFGGSRRRLSEKYGLKVWLCHDTCHIYGKYAVHKNRAVDTNIKEIAQRKAMDKYGWDEQKFINLFGKNYL